MDSTVYGITATSCWYKRLFHLDSNHLGDSVNIVPNGMGDGTVHEEGFILVDDDVAVAKDDSRFALGDDEKMVVVVGMHFRRPAAVQVHIRHGAVDDIADGSEQFLRTEIHVLGGVVKSFIFIVFL